MQIIPESESRRRIGLLQARLSGQNLDGALFVSPIDIYYFAGTRQNGLLWIPVEGAPMLLVRKSFLRAKTESLIADTRPFPSSKEFPAFFNNGIKRIGTTFDIMPVQYYQYFTRLLPSREFADISLINRELRSVKSQWEQERMRESGRRLAEVFSQIPVFLKRGMRELDLAAEMEYHLRKAGSEGAIRLRSFGQEIIGLSSSGAHAAHPGGFDGPVTGEGISSSTPFGPSSCIIEDNVPIIVDYSGTFTGYMMDMTRIFVFGEIEPMLERACDTAIEIQSWLVDNLKPGTICEDLYIGSLGMAEDKGLAAQFMGNPGEQAKFVGHGVGLELDELPVLAKGFKVPLLEGQAVAIEPKFIFPGRGVVGIENTWLVTSSGCEKLTDLSDQTVYL
jgi:Xaa-Pro dipeptidase